MKIIHWAFILLILTLLSCSNDSNPTSTNELNITPTNNDFSLFVGSSSDWYFDINSAVASEDKISLDKYDYEYFGLAGLYFLDEKKTKFHIQVYAKKITTSKLSENITIHIGAKKATFPLHISVNDFEFASQFEINAQDTVTLKKGGNFELKITCKDKQGIAVSRKKIESVAGGITTWITKNYTGDKFIYTSYSRDTMYFYYMLSAFSDITPSVNDTGTAFNFKISNKTLSVPIKLVY